MIGVRHNQTFSVQVEVGRAFIPSARDYGILVITLQIKSQPLNLCLITFFLLLPSFILYLCLITREIKDKLSQNLCKTKRSKETRASQHPLLPRICNTPKIHPRGHLACGFIMLYLMPIIDHHIITQLQQYIITKRSQLFYMIYKRDFIVLQQKKLIYYHKTRFYIKS